MIRLCSKGDEEEKLSSAASLTSDAAALMAGQGGVAGQGDAAYLFPH